VRYIVRSAREGTGWVVYDTKRYKCCKFRTNGLIVVPDKIHAEKWADIWNENYLERGNRHIGPNHKSLIIQDNMAY